jgi:hypothetical protein
MVSMAEGQLFDSTAIQYILSQDNTSKIEKNGLKIVCVKVGWFCCFSLGNGVVFTLTGEYPIYSIYRYGEVEWFAKAWYLR